MIPKALAQVHMAAAEQGAHLALATMQQMVPQLVQQQITEARNEATFYRAWPELKDNRHMPTVMAFAQHFRQYYPQASTEDFVKTVGQQAMAALGLRREQAQAVPPSPAPYRPAQSAAAPPLPAGKPATVFEELAEDFVTNGWT